MALGLEKTLGDEQSHASGGAGESALFLGFGWLILRAEDSFFEALKPLDEVLELLRAHGVSSLTSTGIHPTAFFPNASQISASDLPEHYG